MVTITCGVDIVDVERFRKVPFRKDEKFYLKVFDSDEIEYCLKFKDPYPHFAAKFALKESFQKAVRKPVEMIKIHTKHGTNGEPIIDYQSLKYERIEASLSHEKNYSIAVVLVFW